MGESLDLTGCWVAYRVRDQGGRCIGLKRVDETTLRLCECGSHYIQSISDGTWVTLRSMDILVIRPESKEVGSAEALMDMGAKGQLDVQSLVAFLVRG